MANSALTSVICLVLVQFILLSLVTPLDAARRVKHPPNMSRWGKRLYTLPADSHEEIIGTNGQSLTTTSNPLFNEASSLKTPEECGGPFLKKLRCIIRSRHAQGMTSQHQSIEVSNQDSVNALLVLF
ncbi:uncharacterized protein LOC117108005 [Anneissia japonica]|uniref:uncharacterized protein LOC117108005 n=1 Tax=Anneissia japonica TaxID=1529436 RepID=UPI001425B57D|nr:uncharacterized protein LOC117108005 [Anneissia japonica]XP_033105720.1 uncharacterized protein LOC117108005 [Anneissia japonica]